MTSSTIAANRLDSAALDSLASADGSPYRLIPLLEAARRMPSARRGRRNPSVATLIRWIKFGLPVPGRITPVKLQAVKAGHYFTTQAWLSEFLATTSRQIQPPKPKPRQRVDRFEDEEARRFLAANGVGTWP